MLSCRCRKATVSGARRDDDPAAHIADRIHIAIVGRLSSVYLLLTRAKRSWGRCSRRRAPVDETTRLYKNKIFEKDNCLVYCTLRVQVPVVGRELATCHRIASWPALQNGKRPREWTESTKGFKKRAFKALNFSMSTVNLISQSADIFSPIFKAS